MDVMVQINHANLYGPLSPEKLSEFETEFDIDLPTEYGESGSQMEIVNFVYYQADQIVCLDGNANGACGEVGDIPFSYDDYGNLISNGTKTYAYDAENRLVRISEGTNILAETTGTEAIYYLYGIGLVAQNDGTNTEDFAYDGLGSVRQMLDSVGEVLFAQGFDPYGNPYASAGTSSTNWGFTGEQTDENGLVFLRARYYDPGQGRFLTRDPYSGSVEHPAEFNPNIYGLNNPILHTDPSGKNLLLAALVPALVGLGVTIIGGAVERG